MDFEQSRNPTTEYRHLLLNEVLTELNRSEDLVNIIKLAKQPEEITNIAEANHYQNIKVAVIGAGLAGLASAYELRKLGCDITIFEADKNRIGGRILTHYFSDQLYGELGAMRIPVSHETTWHYINLFKLNTLPFIYNTDNNILYVDRVRIKGLNKYNEIRKYIYPFYDLNSWEKVTPLNKLIEYVYNYVILNMTPNERAQMLTIQQTYPKSIVFYDSLNFFQASNLLGLSDGGKSLLNNTLGIDRGLFYNSYLELLREMYSANFSYLYRVENGNINLPIAFYRALQDNSQSYGRVSFKLGHQVIGIYYNSFNSNIVIKYRVDKDENYENFDYVICAIPFSTLRVIDISPNFSHWKMQAILQVNYDSSQKTLLLCNERFWERTIQKKKIIGGSSLTDLAITTMWYPSNIVDNSYGVLTASYNIDLDAIRLGNMKDYDRIELIKRQLEYVHGLPTNYLDKVVVDYKTINWNRVPYNLGAFSWYAPGQTRIFSYPSYIPEFNNKIFFAGEHISPYHAWMQGALQSGMVAANNLAYFLNLSRYQN